MSVQPMAYSRRLGLKNIQWHFGGVAQTEDSERCLGTRLATEVTTAAQCVREGYGMLARNA